VTLMVKQQQGEMAISTQFLGGLLDHIRSYGSNPFYWLHAALALVGIRQVIVRARHWIPLLLWTFLYVVAYSVLGVSRYFWYYAPLVPAFVVLVAEGAGALGRGLRGVGLPRLWQIAVTGLLLITLLAPLLLGTLAVAWRPDPRLAVYREIGQWLASHTSETSTIGLLEVGIVGYYAQRPVVDFAGLIQPEVARRFTSTTTYQDAATWTIRSYEPDYVLLHPDLFSEVSDSGWFQVAYVPVRDFASTQGPWLTVYRRSETP
jgi:hypothetical protein